MIRSPFLLILFLSLVSFALSAQPGSFWGATYGGFGHGGKIYRFLADGTEPTIIKELIQADGNGSNPVDATLTLASDNNFYGITSQGGKHGFGTIYRFNPTTSAVTKIHDFELLPGFSPGDGEMKGVVVEGPGGYLYGELPTVPVKFFKIKKDGSGYVSYQPDVPMNVKVLSKPASDGNYYGITKGTPSQSLFRMTPGGTITYLVDHFTANTHDQLLQASNGRFYGHRPTGTTTSVFSYPSTGQGGAETAFTGRIQGNFVEGPDLHLYFVDPAAKGIYKLPLNYLNGPVLVYSFKSNQTIVNDPIIIGNTIYAVSRTENVEDGDHIFKVNTDGTGYSVIAELDSESGKWPGGIARGPGNKLFVANRDGGFLDLGNIVSLNTDGTAFSKAHEFIVPTADGANPGVNLELMDNGNMLGVTIFGGANDNGVIFRIDKDDNYHVIHDFEESNGSTPIFAPVAGPNGDYFGITNAGGTNAGGILYKFNPSTGNFSKLYDLDEASGYGSWCGVTVVGNKIYGLTSTGGDNGAGTIFTINADGNNFEVIHHFDSEFGETPEFSRLVAGQDGFLYGSTSGGGDSGDGVLFKIKFNGDDYTVLFEVGTTDYRYLFTEPLIDESGDIFIVASRGGASDRGAILRIDAGNGSHTLLHEFDVALPLANMVFNGRLTIGPDDLIWGLEPNGGTPGTGIVFKMAKDGSTYETIDLGIQNGNIMPWFGLTYAPADEDPEEPGGPGENPGGGNAYNRIWGVAADGARNSGAVFSMKMDGSDFQKVKAFAIDTLGSYTAGGGMTLATDGKLYGMTTKGGLNDNGVIFRYDPATNVYKKLFDFGEGDAIATGKNPLTKLFQSPTNQLLYGSTNFGGENNDGTIFTFNIQTLEFKKLVDLGVSGVGASVAASTAMFEHNGFLYGGFRTGGQGFGSIFKMSLTGDVQNVFEFSSQTLSGLPHSWLLGSDGKIYGTYAWRVFRVNTDGSGFTVLKDFDDDYTTPMQLLESDGYLYGLRPGSGSEGLGSLFRLKKDGTDFSQLHELNGSNEKFISPQTLLLADDGLLYGVCNARFSDNTPTLEQGSSGFFRINKNGTGYQELTSTIEGATNSDLVQIPNGSIYAIGYSTGSGIGSIIKIEKSGIVQEVKDLYIKNDGQYPLGVFQADNGDVIGATSRGGKHNQGVIFKTRADGSFYKVLVDFDETRRGRPFGVPSLDDDGYLYGFTVGESDRRLGWMYRVKLNGSDYQQLHAFTNTDNGANPVGTPLKGIDNKFYGFSSSQYPHNGSSLFGINGDGTEFNVVKTFTGPGGTLNQDDTGFLYGVTKGGGSAGNGTVFKIKPNGDDFEALHVFNTGDGSAPTGGVRFLSDGKLAGGTESGLIYKVDREGNSYQVLMNFNGNPGDPDISYNGVKELQLGKLYGATARGGVKNAGIIYRVNIDGSGYSALVQLGNHGLTSGTNISNYVVVDSRRLTKVEQSISFAVSDKAFSTVPFELTATASSQLQVQYATSSANIALAGSAVTMKGYGKATISAAQEGNETYEAAATVEQTFCINPPKPAITFSAVLPATVLKSSNPNGNQWYKNGNAINGATGANFEPSGDGTYTVKTTVEGCASPMSDNTPVTITGLGDELQTFNLYPNPATEFVDVSIGAYRAGEVAVALIDITGKVIENRISKPGSIERFQTSALKHGIFVIRINSGGTTQTKKFVKH